MQYRSFGSMDWKVSALGFGCMRFPTLGPSGEIDEGEATRMLHASIERGVNYVDTAYVYHGGKSEGALGKALEAGNYRAKVRIATKLPCWLVETAADFDRILNEQLSRLRTDTIDYYLLHALNRGSWKKMRELGALSWAESAIRDGRIRHLGFSFHDAYDVFQDIVDGYDAWDFCQIQYNYVDVENQAGTRGLKYAAAKGLAVVVMEPLLGGRLVNPPATIQDIWDGAAERRSAADWALRWLWDQPEVSVVLSGMGSMGQVNENLASAEASSVHSLSGDDQARVARVREKYRELSPIPCTRCGYCMPCPNGVNIPRNFEAYNGGLMYDKQDWARTEYTRWISPKERAVNCVDCGQCEPNCPQKIPISDWMPAVHAVLGENRPYILKP